MKAVIPWAVIAFIVVKFLFGFLGWYSQEDKDPLYRRRLDAVWDRLHEGSFFDFVHLVLQRLVQRAQETFPRKWITIGLFVVFSFILNVFSVFVSHELVAAGQYGRTYLIGQSLGIILMDWHFTHYVIVALSTLGLVLDVLSLWISFELLKKAANSFSLGQVLIHLCIDILFMGTALWGAAYASFLSYAVAVYSMSGTNSVKAVYIPLTYYLNILQMMGKPLSDQGWYFAAPILCVGVSVTFPTLAYMFVGLLALCARVTPKVVQRFVTKCIFLVTTDKTPVLSQLGTVAGAVAAFLAALLKYVL